MERQSRLKLDLGGEQIELLRLDASEGLSEHFAVSVDILATLGEIDLKPHLGKPGVIGLYEDDELQRYFHGIVVDARFVEFVDGVGYIYRLTLRPRSFLHEQGLSYRIFQTQSARDIILATLERCGITHEMRISSASRQRAYCVQYGESDFSFVSRLLEEEGLYYFYKHAEYDHVMVICDSAGSHDPLPHPSLNYSPRSGDVFNADSALRTSGTAGHFVQTWHEHLSTGSEGVVTLRDFDFIKPERPREAAAEEPLEHDGDPIEIYDYPGRYYEEGDGRQLSKFVLEARRARRVEYSSTAQYPGLQCGHTFSLAKHPIDRFNGGYLVVRTQHSVSTEQYRSHMGPGEDGWVEFTAVPSDTQFRAPLVTRRPVVRGPETAIVTGPQGEEIHVDKYGRVKVKFHWDREGKDDDTSSCWVRVSQTGGLGNIIIPRVGHEVLIDFINGDPDRPIVVGRVFNEQHMPVYALPEHKTKALWRTKRYGEPGSYGSAVSLDTGTPGANELRFEDKGGSEEVFIHAERDMNSRIRHCETHHVGLDQSSKIGQNRTEDVGSNEKITVGQNREVKIGTDDKLNVGQKLVIEAGTEIEIKAGQKITLVVGGSKIVLEPAKIAQTTVKVDIEGSAAAKLSGALTNVEASGVLTAKGALVKIN